MIFATSSIDFLQEFHSFLDPENGKHIILFRNEFCCSHLIRFADSFPNTKKYLISKVQAITSLSWLFFQKECLCGGFTTQIFQSE